MDEESNISDINENSDVDVSQNGLPLLPFNNNNIEQELQKESMDMDLSSEIEEVQQEDLEDAGNQRLDSKQTSDVLQEYVNGNVFPRRTSSTTSSSTAQGGDIRSLETQESSESRVPGTGQGKNDETVGQKLEKEVVDLKSLLFLKEQEWNSVLKLLKLKEIFLAQLKRRKELKEILESVVPPDSGDNYLKLLLTQITTETLRTGASAVHVQNSINETEKEIGEVGKLVSNTENIVGKAIDSHTEAGNESCQVESFFLASNALKNLVNKNKTTLTSHSIPAVSNTMLSSPTAVVGEGRHGTMLDVSSLIESYREKTPTFEKRKASRKRSSTVNSTPKFTPMNQSASISFTDVLSRLKTESEVSICGTNSSSILTNKTLTNKGKCGSTPNSNSMSGVGENKAPVGTTLAKLLSSNSVSTTGRSSDENVTFSSKSSSNKIPNADKNLSLANLLASSKRNDDPNKPKIIESAVPLCQGCSANKAQFVCAGCANQWYCSRECQVAAWDEHSEVCSG